MDRISERIPTLRRALVVDDHAAMRRLITASIRDEFDVTLAHDGVEGLAALRASTVSPFDVVITDVEMPRMSGVEMILIALQRVPRLNVLFVTAQAPEAPERAALSKLGFPVLSKPFGIVEFGEALRMAVSGVSSPEHSDAD